MTDVEEIAGRGVKATVDGHTVCVGNSKMMADINMEWHDCHLPGTIVHVAVDGRYAGHIVINDQIKADSAEAVASLKRIGVERTVMLTGDREGTAKDVAEKVGIDEYHSELLPSDKVAHVERLLKEKPAGKNLAFVGDGINDAPVLKRADVGIAMGALGSDVAIDAADVVLMDDKPSKIATAIAIQRAPLSHRPTHHSHRPPERVVCNRRQSRHPYSRRFRTRHNVDGCVCRRRSDGYRRAQRHEGFKKLNSGLLTIYFESLFSFLSNLYDFSLILH